MIKFGRWAIILLCGAAAWCAPAAGETLLRFNSWLPPTHPVMSLTIRPWAEEVAKVTQNRVKFEFTAQSMGPPPNQFDMVKDGVLRDHVAAVSCGIYKGAAVLDLDYAEDSAAEADSNFVMTGAGGIVEVQGTAETVAFSQESFDQLMVLAKKGIGELVALQKLTVV